MDNKIRRRALPGASARAYRIGLRQVMADHFRKARGPVHPLRRVACAVIVRQGEKRGSNPALAPDPIPRAVLSQYTVPAVGISRYVARLDAMPIAAFQTAKAYPIQLARVLAVRPGWPVLAVPMHLIQAIADVVSNDAQIVIVDDDLHNRNALQAMVEAAGYRVAAFASGECFLADLARAPATDRARCVLIDAFLGGVGGLGLLAAIRATESTICAIMVAYHGDVAMAVSAMKGGAVDFLERPIKVVDLFGALKRGMAIATVSVGRAGAHLAAAASLSGLTIRERQIMELVLAGHPSKNIAADLCINQRTVENHRASVMKKTGAASIPALARLAVLAQ